MSKSLTALEAVERCLGGAYAQLDEARRVLESAGVEIKLDGKVVEIRTDLDYVYRIAAEVRRLTAARIAA